MNKALIIRESEKERQPQAPVVLIGSQKHFVYINKVN